MVRKGIHMVLKHRSGCTKCIKWLHMEKHCRAVVVCLCAWSKTTNISQC